VKQGGAHDGSTLAAGRFPGVPVMRWGGAVPRGTTTVRRTDLGGWGKGKLTRGRPSTAVKSGGGESMLAGRSGGQWWRWSGRRAPGHRVEARGHIGGTRQWPEQAVRMEDTGGGSIEGNRHQRRYTVAIGVGGRVGVVTGGRAGPKVVSAGRFRVRVSRSSALHAADMTMAFLGAAAVQGVEAGPHGRRRSTWSRRYAG
jgi:hypothetical protein